MLKVLLQTMLELDPYHDHAPQFLFANFDSSAYSKDAFGSLDIATLNDQVLKWDLFFKVFRGLRKEQVFDIPHIEMVTKKSPIDSRYYWKLGAVLQGLCDRQVAVFLRDSCFPWCSSPMIAGTLQLFQWIGLHPDLNGLFKNFLCNLPPTSKFYPPNWIGCLPSASDTLGGREDLEQVHCS